MGHHPHDLPLPTPRRCSGQAHASKVSLLRLVRSSTRICVSPDRLHRQGATALPPHRRQACATPRLCLPFLRLRPDLLASCLRPSALSPPAGLVAFSPAPAAALARLSTRLWPAALRRRVGPGSAKKNSDPWHYTLLLSTVFSVRSLFPAVTLLQL